MKRIKIDGKIYTLKFTAQSVLQAEKQLGKSIWSALGAENHEYSEEEIEDAKKGIKPKTKQKVKISSIKMGDYFILFWSCLLKNHKGIDLDTGLDIADSWFDQEGKDEDGNERNTATFMQMLMKVITESSIINKIEEKALEPVVPDYVTDKGDQEVKK